MIRSSRTRFVAFHATEAVRDELLREAERQGTSVSLLVYDIVREHLGLPEEQVKRGRRGDDAFDQLPAP